MNWLRNAWYVAASDGEAGQAPLARTLLCVPVMLYRKLDGTPVAMRDACPHRLQPLSLGIEEGDSIRCRYHGLKLGSDGCAEERDDPSLIPDLWPCSAPDWTFDGGYVPVACDYRLMIDNLMDLTHETYVHSDSIGQIELMEAPIETRGEADRVFVTRWMPGVEVPPFWSMALRRAGLVDHWQICEFVPPSCVMIDVGVAPVGAGATIANYDQGVRGFVIDALTPESETRNFLVEDPGFTVRFKTQQGGVFVQDVEILEAQQRSIERMIALENTR